MSRAQVWIEGQRCAKNEAIALAESWRIQLSVAQKDEFTFRIEWRPLRVVQSSKLAASDLSEARDVASQTGLSASVMLLAHLGSFFHAHSLSSVCPTGIELVTSWTPAESHALLSGEVASATSKLFLALLDGAPVIRASALRAFLTTCNRDARGLTFPFR